jgi:hypothetical protein
MHIDYWEYMVRTGEDPFCVRQALGLDSNGPRCGREGSSPGADPDWCFQRFGMTRTAMSDERILCIGGEHEDWYDPDFCIYNDVTVLRPDAGHSEVTIDSGAVEIYGYPPEEFPPTDFHSATLVDRQVYVIGRLGYANERKGGVTPIFRLNVDALRIEQVPATGPCPGWIYSHHASYDAGRHAITVRGGKIHIPDAKREALHTAAFRLHLADHRWELLSENETHLRLSLARGPGLPDRYPTAASFRPQRVPHDWLGSEDAGFDRHSISVAGVRIMFEDCIDRIAVLVEGELDPQLTDHIVLDVLSNLERDTGSEWRIED